MKKPAAPQKPAVKPVTLDQKVSALSRASSDAMVLIAQLEGKLCSLSRYVQSSEIWMAAALGFTALIALIAYVRSGRGD